MNFYDVSFISFAFNQYNMNQRLAQKALERLITGKQINSASDNPSQMLRLSRLEAQIRGNQVAKGNIQDSIAMIQTATDSLSHATELGQRLRELSVQYQSDTVNDEDRLKIQNEAQLIMEEINKTLKNTKYNRISIFSKEEYSIQTGANTEDKYKLVMPNQVVATYQKTIAFESQGITPSLDIKTYLSVFDTSSGTNSVNDTKQQETNSNNGDTIEQQKNPENQYPSPVNEGNNDKYTDENKQVDGDEFIENNGSGNTNQSGTNQSGNTVQSEKNDENDENETNPSTTEDNEENVSKLRQFLRNIAIDIIEFAEKVEDGGEKVNNKFEEIHDDIQNKIAENREERRERLKRLKEKLGFKSDDGADNVTSDTEISINETQSENIDELLQKIDSLLDRNNSSIEEIEEIINKTKTIFGEDSELTQNLEELFNNIKNTQNPTSSTDSSNNTHNSTIETPQDIDIESNGQNQYMQNEEKEPPQIQNDFSIYFTPENIDRAILEPLSEALSTIGIQEYILEKRLEFADVKDMTLNESLSSIQDVDVAKEYMAKVKYEMLTSVGMAMIHQSLNYKRENILSLLG